jgi:hypothetical protein
MHIRIPGGYKEISSILAWTAILLLKTGRHNRTLQKSELKTKKQDRTIKESELKTNRHNRPIQKSELKTKKQDRTIKDRNSKRTDTIGRLKIGT